MIAYFDCFSGISGDMTLGALLDCGVPLEALREGLASLPVKGWEIQAHPILQSGIHALDVTISLNGVTDADEWQAIREAKAPDKNHSPDHSHQHETQSPAHAVSAHHHGVELHHAHHHHQDHHDAERADNTEHEQHGGHRAEHAHGRSMAEIKRIIEASQLSARVKETSLRIFRRIAEVEAYLHHTTPEEIHFHEIGGIDSLLDICGAAWCLEYLDVDEVFCSPLPHSSGFVDCQHGRMPVPAPATLELLKGVPLVPSEVQGEMVTPTGAGIVTTLSQGFGAMPPLTPRHIGFGSGKKRFADRPNLLRIVIGDRLPQTGAATENGGGLIVNIPAPSEAATTQATALESQTELEGLEWQTLSVIECNIDDMNPEFFDSVLERLFAAGALDVWVQPLQMKKNRPGWLLGVLCPLNFRAALITAILRETTTLGVRLHEVRRAALPRESGTVETEFGPVRVKVARWAQGKIERCAPEYSDVARLAAQHNVPAQAVYQAALFSAQAQSQNKKM